MRNILHIKDLDKLVEKFRERVVKVIIPNAKLSTFTIRRMKMLNTPFFKRLYVDFKIQKDCSSVQSTQNAKSSQSLNL